MVKSYKWPHDGRLTLRKGHHQCEDEDIWISLSPIHNVLHQTALIQLSARKQIQLSARMQESLLLPKEIRALKACTAKRTRGPCMPLL